MIRFQWKMNYKRDARRPQLCVCYQGIQQAVVGRSGKVTRPLPRMMKSTSMRPTMKRMLFLANLIWYCSARYVSHSSTLYCRHLCKVGSHHQNMRKLRKCLCLWNWSVVSDYSKGIVYTSSSKCSLTLNGKTVLRIWSARMQCEKNKILPVMQAVAGMQNLQNRG